MLGLDRKPWLRVRGLTSRTSVPRNRGLHRMATLPARHCEPRCWTRYEIRYTLLPSTTATPSLARRTLRLHSGIGSVHVGPNAGSGQANRDRDRDREAKSAEWHPTSKTTPSTLDTNSNGTPSRSRGRRRAAAETAGILAQHE